MQEDEMGHNNHYSDSEGLQAVQNESFPEVVPGQNLARQSTLESPEVVPGSEMYHDNKHAQSASYGSATPMNEGYFAGHNTPPQYQDYPGKEVEGLNQSRAQRRVCGMPRKRFIWVAILIVAIIILAAVLGGVLGSVLGNSDDKSSNSTSTQPQTGNSTTSAAEKRYTAVDKTGTALLAPASGSSIYSYYMSSDGLVEAEFTNGLSSNATEIKSTIIATNAKSTSPIAAVEVTPPSATLYRIVYYFDKNNHPTFVNVTGTGNW